ncbi:FixH family protein [Rubripirellula reticaptiva]|uniref:FixH n=1 Tax=Rubripirellula reticaptiva TaxID=2528013 RepID=A0A5C6F5Y2_9BACT|nr:FixH family protein [Rubripirellula reticaptiva]TWU55249.1 FixH [Rubripirellula reticaptiva]
MQTEKAKSEFAAERSARRFWVSLVVVLLGLQLVIGFVAIRLATGDPTVAVVPDYHNEALDWDMTRREVMAAERMGWSVEIEASDVSDGNGFRATEVSVTDESGNPVDDLRIVGSVYHHARASDIERFELPSVGKGRYLTLAPMARPGLWQVEIFIEGAEVPMRKSVEIDIPTT